MIARETGSRASRRNGLYPALLGLSLARCGDGTLPDPRTDARVDVPRTDGTIYVGMDSSGPSWDGDSPLGDAATDARVPVLDAALDVRGTNGSLDAGPPPCDPRFAVIPSAPNEDQSFEVRFTDRTAWTFIGLRWTGPRTPAWRFLDVVARDPFTWAFRVDPTAAGRYTVAFTADNDGRTVGMCTLDVRAAARADAGSPIEASLPRDASPTVDGSAPGDLPFVTRAGTEFTAGGSRVRFVGMNSAGLTHYGAPPLPFARVEQIAAELDELRRMGARVVRVFAAAEDAPHDVVAARLGRVLDLARERGLYVLVALTDFYASTPYHPQGDRRFYARDPRFPIDLLSPAFFRGGFREHYLPWARGLAARFADHPAVFAWELGNEIKCDDDHAAFIAFAREVSSALRAADPRHMITTGMITGRWATDAEAREIYRIPTIDFVTYHNYEGTMEFADFDYAVARDTTRPLIVEEAAFESGDRPARVDADLRAHVDGRGARGYMQWGFMSVTPDNGNGDRRWGMDRVFHSDYDGLFRVYAASAARLR
jgi:hypothetical protein